jgi:hypothetical protein
MSLDGNLLSYPNLEEHMEVQTEKRSEHEKPRLVEITIDGKKFEVRHGDITVAALKELGGVPAGYEIEEIEHGKLFPLKDDGHVEIKGGGNNSSATHVTEHLLNGIRG